MPTAQDDVLIPAKQYVESIQKIHIQSLKIQAQAVLMIKQSTLKIIGHHKADYGIFNEGKLWNNGHIVIK